MSRVRIGVSVLALLLCLSWAMPATATPVTVTFSGELSLIDFEWKNKDLCALMCEYVAAFADAGFYNHAPLSLSLTFDDQTPLSVDGSMVPVIRGSFSLSQWVYDLNATSLVVGGGGLLLFADLSGPPINGPGPLLPTRLALYGLSSRLCGGRRDSSAHRGAVNADA